MNITADTTPKQDRVYTFPSGTVLNISQLDDRKLLSHVSETYFGSPLLEMLMEEIHDRMRKGEASAGIPSNVPPFDR